MVSDVPGNRASDAVGRAGDPLGDTEHLGQWDAGRRGNGPRVSCIVLAAGSGSRMRSTRPKPLHRLCGKPMVLYVLEALTGNAVGRTVVVVGQGAERITKALHEFDPDLRAEFVEQRVPRGTADAVAVGLTAFEDDLDLMFADDDVLVLPGDAPLLRAETIAALVDHHRRSGAVGTVLTTHVADPAGLGRIERGRDGQVVAITASPAAGDLSAPATLFGEADGATPIANRPDGPDPVEPANEQAGDHAGLGAEHGVEVNTHVYCFRRSLLAPALRRLTPNNLAGEYRLPDVIRVLADAGHPITTHAVADPSSTFGVNDRGQLAMAEAELRRRVNDGWLDRGVTMVDPERTYVDSTVVLGADVTLFPGTMLGGNTVIGDGAEIGPLTRLIDCAVGSGARVENSVGRDAEVGPNAIVGPYAVLDPGAQVAPHERTGPYFHDAGSS